jgi:carbonic anhydrase
MKIIEELIRNNKEWAEQTQRENPDFFNKLANEQHPEILWIGCSDSRVSSNVVTMKRPGDIFVHRNVANLVVNTDFNMLSVLQYAVEYLKVKCIIVCGHYNCGGVTAAYHGKQLGLIDNWLSHIRDVYYANRKEVDSYATETERIKRLCEINVKQQAHNVCHTTIVQNAWRNGQELSVCGMIYDVSDGSLKDLKVILNSTESIPKLYIVE